MPIHPEEPSETPAVEPAATAEPLPPRPRGNVRRNSRPAARPRKPITFASLRETLQVGFIPAAAALVLVVATLILMRMPADPPQPSAKTAPSSDSPAAAPPTVAPPALVPAPPPTPAPEPPSVVQRGSVVATDFPTLDLPVQSKKSDLRDLAQSIRDRHQLPPRESIRLEEMLNQFSYRLNGVVAIARGAAKSWQPEVSDADLSGPLATLSSEMIACPWKPSATLLFINLRGNARKDCQARIVFHANPENVAHYRLLGYASPLGQTTGPMPTLLRANSATLLAIEIEASKPSGDLGSLEWLIDDNPAPTISLTHRADAEPSNDACFAALVCAYAQWLAGEQTEAITAEMISALAREVTSASQPAERAEFIDLIEPSLHL